MADINRREFLAAASAFTIVPRRVLGGRGYIPPSDMILLAQVGCGMQAQRQVNTRFVTRPELQFVAVVDPNRNSQNYPDWSNFGNRNSIRQFLGDPTWCEGDNPAFAGRGGREVAQHIMETYYKKQNRPSAGIRSYEDYREMLEKETDIQGIVAITPDHQHASINIAALKKGKAAIAHKPVALLPYELRRTLEASKAGSAGTHLLAYSNTPDRHTLEAWIKGGVIGTVREVHNWTNRPFWPQGWQEDTSPRRRSRRASTGRCGRARRSIVPTIRTTRTACIAAGTTTAPDAWVTWVSIRCGSRIASSSSACRYRSRPVRTTTPR